MEVYEAISDFHPRGSGNNVLALRQRDRVEVLESKRHRPYRQWWGVRRLRDHAVGFVPSKHLEYDETIPIHLLPDGYQAQKDQQLRQLDSMQQANQLPENNNYGPSFHQMQSLRHEHDKWQQPAYRGSLPGPYEQPPHPPPHTSSWLQMPMHNPCYDPIEEPAPDYSDDENEKPQNGLHFLNGRQFRQNGKPQGGSLTAQDWKNIVESAESDFPAPPPMARTPEPDYQYGSQPFGGSSENLPQIIRPHPNSDFHKQPADSNFITHKLRNPCLESKERMAVHKELLMNTKMGVDVLHRKSELRRALDKRADERRKKDHEEYLKSRKSVFEKRLEVQANKYKEYEVSQNKKTNPTATSKSQDDKEQPEFLRIHSKIYKGKAS